MRRMMMGLWARLRDVVFRRAVDREMDEELRFHLEMETEKNIRAGLSPSEARRRALIAFGGVERHREQLREGRRMPVLESLWCDLRFGARSLARTPGLTVVAALTIALGVGATTTVFSAVNALLLRPIHLPAPERLVTIQERRSGMVSNGIEGMLIPYPRYQEYRDATEDVFTSLAAHRLVDGFALRLPEETLSVNGALTSGNYFQTLGVRPILGRAYASDDAPEIVISHQLWLSSFSGDPSVVGRSIAVDGRSVTVVGVAPAGFTGVTLVADQLWAPVGIRGVGPMSWSIRVVPVGRLKDGVALPQASGTVDALGRSIPPEEQTTVHRAILDPVGPVPMQGRGYAIGFFGMLLGTALFVLLIAAADIAAIMVARGVARRQEMAVRLALGAGRGRIVRHLLAESVMIFVLGGALGIGVARIGAAWLSTMEFPPQVPPLLLDFTLDARVLAFATLATGLTGLVFGLAPALGSSRPDLIPALKSGAAASVGGSSRIRDFFVGGQIAMAVMLLLGATLFARSLTLGMATDLGFDANGIVAATISLGPPHDYDRESGQAFTSELMDRVRALDGVESVGMSQYGLLSGMRNSGYVRAAEGDDAAGTPASFSAITPGFLRAMRIPLEAGREFSDADVPGTSPVAVVNRTLADRLWPGESPIGKRLTGPMTPEPLEVVGVTSDGKYFFVTEEVTPFVFFSYDQFYRGLATLHARSPGHEGETLRAIVDIVRSMDPDVAVTRPTPLSALIGTSLFPQRFATQLIGAFGIIGLVLAALGVYGVVAYQVVRRTRELGIRRALGASPRSVVWTVLGWGAMTAAVGCGVGTALGAVFAFGVRSFLFGIHPLDPVAFVLVPLSLLAVALVASWVPAAKAARVEASVALRTE